MVACEVELGAFLHLVGCFSEMFHETFTTPQSIFMRKDQSDKPALQPKIPPVFNQIPCETKFETPSFHINVYMTALF